MIRRSQAGCREVGRKVQSFLDGELDPENRRRIERHLDDCRRCGLEADAYRDIKASLAGHDGDVDPSVIERLRVFGSRIAGGSDG